MHLLPTLFLLFTLISLVSSDNWAVLIAGSHTWSNYRHQSDIYHAYQILIKNGFNQNRIVTFAYDDIAHNLYNTFKGRVFNKPSYKNPGKDVYGGVKLDYTGREITPQVFIGVLVGNKTAVHGKGTERVL
jgi:legumain